MIRLVYDGNHDQAYGNIGLKAKVRETYFWRRNFLRMSGQNSWKT
jgi:hypothetical protein